MEHPVRKRSIPGTKSIIRDIREISDKIQKIDNEIKMLSEKITLTNQELRRNSPRNALQSQLNEIMQKLKEYKIERSEKRNEVEVYNKRLENIQEEKKKVFKKERGLENARTADDVEKEIRKANMDLIYESLSPKEDKLISQRLMNLKAARAKFENAGDKDKQIQLLWKIKKECDMKIKELGAAISEKNAKREKIKAELDKLMSENNKSPEVIMFETQINALRNEKKGLLQNKNEKREELKKVEEEFNDFENKYQEQKKIEENRNDIKKNIQELKNQQEKLMSSAGNCDPKVLDSMAFKISELQNSKSLNLDIALVDLLIKHGFAIPKKLGDFNDILLVIKDKRSNMDDMFKKHKEEIKSKMNDLNNKINDEKEKLSKLPQTDYEILKRGAKYRIFN